MKLKKIIAGHLLVLALVFPQAVFAAGEYTFNVGVNLVNLHPDVTAVKINCQALKNPDSGMVALGATEINVPASGNINQTVVVKANLFRTAGRNSVVSNPGDANILFVIFVFKAHSHSLRVIAHAMIQTMIGNAQKIILYSFRKFLV